MECPKCSEEIDRSIFSSDVAYCPYCGQDLNSGGPAVNMSYCPYCGQELVAGARFCPNCGRKLALKPRRRIVRRFREEEGDEAAGPRQPLYKKIFDSLAKNLAMILSSERKTRRLYGQWAEYADLSPEEIRALEAQTEMSDEWKRREQRMRIAVIAGVILVVIIALTIVFVVFL